MARRWLQATLALVVFTAATATLSSAQQTAAAAFPAWPSCPPAPLSLSPCIGYVFGAGSATLASCCSQLRGFLQAQAPCICAASKLAPSPVGLFLGQAQAMVPNVCDLPNPCDAAAGEGSVPPASAPPVADDTPSPSATTTPAATAPATEPLSGTPPAADPDTSGAPPTPTEDASATAVAVPAGNGSKLPELLHAAGATSSRDVAAGAVFVAAFLASVATMYV